MSRPHDLSQVPASAPVNLSLIETQACSGHSCEARRPDFAIIGAQKAATTLVQRILMQHRGIFMPPGEYAAFECGGISSEEAASNLAAKLALAATGSIVGFKRPDVLCSELACERLASAFPDLRVIAVLRDPVDRLISAYYHYMSHGLAPPVPVKRALPFLITGQWVDRYPRLATLVDYGMYGKYLEGWRERFSAESILILIQEAFLENPGDGAERIFKFLGLVSPVIDIPKRSSDTNSVAYSVVRGWWGSCRHGVEFTVNRGRGGIQPLRLTRWRNRLLKANRWVDQAILRRLCKDDRGELTEEDVKTISEVYRNDNKKLVELLGFQPFPRFG